MTSNDGNRKIFNVLTTRGEDSSNNDEEANVEPPSIIETNTESLSTVKPTKPLDEWWKRITGYTFPQPRRKRY